MGHPRASPPKPRATRAFGRHNNSDLKFEGLRYKTLTILTGHSPSSEAVVAYNCVKPISYGFREMNATNRRQNTRGLATTFNASNSDRPRSNGEAEKDMWSSMLDGVASGKKLPEKNILVLGRSISIPEPNELSSELP